jgi:hypothetical protein
MQLTRIAPHGIAATHASRCTYSTQYCVSVCLRVCLRVCVSNIMILFSGADT